MLPFVSVKNVVMIDGIVTSMPARNIHALVNPISAHGFIGHVKASARCRDENLQVN